MLFSAPSSRVQIVEEGVAHHVCLTYGDYREQLKLYASYAGIPVVEI